MKILIEKSKEQIDNLIKKKRVLERRLIYIKAKRLIDETNQKQVNKEKDLLEKDKEDLIGRKSIVVYEIKNKEKELKKKDQNQLIDLKTLQLKITELNVEKVSIEKDLTDLISKNHDISIKRMEAENEISQNQTRIKEILLEIQLNDEKYEE